MTVEEVIKSLEALPKDMLVLQSSDAEGNSIRDFAEASKCYLFKESYGYDAVADEDVEGDDPEYDVERDGLLTAVVLWPV